MSIYSVPAKDQAKGAKMNKTALPSQEWKVSWVSLFRCVLAYCGAKVKEI